MVPSAVISVCGAVFEGSASWVGRMVAWVAVLAVSGSEEVDVGAGDYGAEAGH